MPRISIHPVIDTQSGVRTGGKAPRMAQGGGFAKISPVEVAPTNALGFDMPAPTRPHAGSKTIHNGQTFTFPNDKNVYGVMDSLSMGGFLQLGIRDPKTGELRQAPITMSPDGHGGWQRDHGAPGGGQGNTKHASESAPLLGSSGSRRSGSSAGHSFGNQSGWGNASTGSPGAYASTSSGSSGFQSGWSNASTGSPGAPASASSGAPPLPPRNPRAGTSSSTSGTTPSSRGSAFGPVPDKRYLTDPGDGMSKYWFIYKETADRNFLLPQPADSSIDSYARPKDAPRNGMELWQGPKKSKLLPPE